MYIAQATIGSGSGSRSAVGDSATSGASRDAWSGGSTCGAARSGGLDLRGCSDGEAWPSVDCGWTMGTGSVRVELGGSAAGCLITEGRAATLKACRGSASDEAHRTVSGRFGHNRMNCTFGSGDRNVPLVVNVFVLSFVAPVFPPLSVSVYSLCWLNRKRLFVWLTDFAKRTSFDGDGAARFIRPILWGASNADSDEVISSKWYFQDLEELMKEVQEARRIKMLHQPSKEHFVLVLIFLVLKAIGDYQVMDMEHELRALRSQLAEKSKRALHLQKELAMCKSREKNPLLYELDGPEALGSILLAKSSSFQELPNKFMLQNLLMLGEFCKLIYFQRASTLCCQPLAQSSQLQVLEVMLRH
ncbi:hypothetical protein NL676_004564 [Syzygium grande]|nr:hypothetical protein NL676_004564 [Syzygium grande]